MFITIKTVWRGKENANMATVLRPEISKKNKYWIEKQRYFELKHFCLQYRTWQKAYLALDGLSKYPVDMAIPADKYTHGNPTESCMELRERYRHNMELVEQAAIEADVELANYILVGVTEGISYDLLKARLEIPCCKETYYNAYRRFFWLLSKKRG